MANYFIEADFLGSFGFAHSEGRPEQLMVAVGTFKRPHSRQAAALPVH